MINYHYDGTVFTKSLYLFGEYRIVKEPSDVFIYKHLPKNLYDSNFDINNKCVRVCLTMATVYCPQKA